MDDATRRILSTYTEMVVAMAQVSVIKPSRAALVIGRDNDLSRGEIKQALLGAVRIGSEGTVIARQLRIKHDAAQVLMADICSRLLDELLG